MVNEEGGEIIDLPTGSRVIPHDLSEQLISGGAGTTININNPVVREDKDIDMVRQLLTAHEYWSTKGLKVDLVIVNLQISTYFEPLHNSINDLICSSYARDKQNKPGGVFVYNRARMMQEDIDLLNWLREFCK